MKNRGFFVKYHIPVNYESSKTMPKKEGVFYFYQMLNHQIFLLNPSSMFYLFFHFA